MRLDDGRLGSGFDFEASRAAGKVVGVKKGSQAWNAGLRNDQSLLGWSVTYGQSDVPVKLTIKNKIHTEQVLRYLPQADAIDIPQFSAPAKPKDCDQIL